ncbi:type II toxin-antitoxin system HicA family toxin, partial [Roseateles sp. GG27B]
MLAKFASITQMNTRQRKTLRAIFAHPTSASIVFADIESLILGLGGDVHEREGSRVKILLKGEQWRCHRPHPGKEAKRYQIEEAREMLIRVGVLP